MSSSPLVFDICRQELAGIIFKVIQSASDASLPFTAADIQKTIERPKDESMGDYALPCFRFAKALGKTPPALAQWLAEQMQSPWLESTNAAGPFLNLKVSGKALAAAIIPAVTDKSFFSQLKNLHDSRPRVMIEYSQPNTHKVFHVGHMRNVALGDSLWRLYEYAGYPVTPVNYIGDEGTHIAKCLWYIQHTNAKAPSTGKGEWLGEMYVKATFALEDADEAKKTQYEQEISAILRAIESKSGPMYDLWKETRAWSMDVFNEIYAWLGARFDHVFFESDVSEESQTIVDEYLKKGVFVEDQGAIGVDLKEQKLGFALLRKRDGNTLYATKDLALARHKFDQFKIDKSIYVVGSEQNLHFRQVFKVLELMGFSQAKDCYHLSYGLVVLPEGKMSSRRGNIIAFAQLKENMSTDLGKILDKYRGEWSDAEIADTTHRLCVGAIRYGMLSSDPSKEIVFNLSDWLSFEGNTGPYLMYSYARARSILRKAEEVGAQVNVQQLDQLGVEPEEHDLLWVLYNFNDMVASACETNKPSTLTHYLFDLCKTFNRFHKNVSVMKADTPALRDARLALVDVFATVLKEGMQLLGMTPPERM